MDGTLEVDLGGVAIYDVARLLPRLDGARARSNPIDLLMFHESGRLGRPGFRGLLNSARFTTREKGLQGRGWFSVAYHFWAPFHDLYDEDGRRVLFRAAEDSLRCPHTKGLNGGPRDTRSGVSFAFQGNTSKHGLSAHQAACAGAFLLWALGRYGLTGDDIGWHSCADKFGGTNPKPSCPGRGAEAFLHGYLAGLMT